MPKISGYDVLKEAKSAYPNLPIIFVTGKGQPQKIVESLANYGLDGYIEKPFEPKRVLDLVAKTIKK
jgi:DNA-binding response OmpR family regulator